MTTERMTDEQFETRMDSAQAMNGWRGMYQEAVTEAERARRVEQEQAEKIRALEGKLALVMGERDAAETKAAHVEARLKVAHETITTTNDKLAEQVRQARYDIIVEAMQRCPMPSSRQERLALFWDWAQSVCHANAPKD